MELPPLRQRAGSAGYENGELLANADGAFEAFVMIDRSLTVQQEFGRFQLHLNVVKSMPKRMMHRLPSAPRFLAADDPCKPGEADLVG